MAVTGVIKVTLVIVGIMSPLTVASCGLPVTPTMFMVSGGVILARLTSNGVKLKRPSIWLDRYEIALA